MIDTLRSWIGTRPTGWPFWALKATALGAVLGFAVLASALLLTGVWGNTAPTASALPARPLPTTTAVAVIAEPTSTVRPTMQPTPALEPTSTATPVPTDTPVPLSEQPAAPPGTQPEVQPVAPTATEPPPPPASCPTAPLTGYASALFNAINSERDANGRPGLSVDGCAVYVAQLRSNDMATVGYFSHTSPTGESAFSLLDAYGVPHGWAGENLARNNYPDGETVAVAIRDLMASAGHRDNILSPNYTRLGVAVAFDGAGMKYFTMVFIGPP